MIWVWTVSLPVTILNSPAVTRYPQHDFGTGRDIAGIVLYAIGMIMESLSDVQKYKFRKNHDGKAVCDKGFFAVSRHPNYFGDILIQFCKFEMKNTASCMMVCRFLSLITVPVSHLHDCSLSRSGWLRSGPGF